MTEVQFWSCKSWWKFPHWFQNSQNFLKHNDGYWFCGFLCCKPHLSLDCWEDLNECFYLDIEASFMGQNDAFKKYVYLQNGVKIKQSNKWPTNKLMHLNIATQLSLGLLPGPFFIDSCSLLASYFAFHLGVLMTTLNLGTTSSVPLGSTRECFFWQFFLAGSIPQAPPVLFWTPTIQYHS